MEFRNFLNKFVSINKRIYKKLIIFSIFFFYFCLLIFYNYFRSFLSQEFELSWCLPGTQSVYGFVPCASWGLGTTFSLITTLIFFLLIDLLVIGILEKLYVLGGVIITNLISFFLSIILPLNLVYTGDLQMVIGSIIGISYTLKKIKSNQSKSVYGIIVGLGGNILTVILFIMLEGLVLSWSLMVTPLMLMSRIEFYLIEAIIISLGTGIIIGGYYDYKNKMLIKSSSKDEILLEKSINEGV
ncbi:MAG: hypothetical protein ACFFDF_04270 [Candidatus Odinarchaeota archaeon]